jgi:hypothetical protein
VSDVSLEQELRRLGDARLLCVDAGRLADELRLFGRAHAQMAESTSRLANHLLGVLERPWVDPSADRVLLTSLANFAGVLESLSALQRSLAAACTGADVLQPLELVRQFGTHECEQRFGALETTFAAYDDVVKEIGPLLAGGKKLNTSGRKKGAHFDASKLEQFDKKIAERTQHVVTHRDEFTRACDQLAERKVDALAAALDSVVGKVGAAASQAVPLFANLADVHLRIKSCVEEQSLAPHCATSPLPRITATRATALFAQLGAAPTSAVPQYGDARLRYVATFGCDLRHVELDKPFEPAKGVLNLRLCALRPVELPQVPAGVDAALGAHFFIPPLAAPVSALEIVPHIGAPLRLLFGSAALRDDWLRHAGELVTAALSDAPLDLLSPRERDLSQRAGRILRAVPGNRVCADCSAPEPQWVSTTLGAVVCVRCAGVHRQLGGSVSRVRSIALDRWQPELLMTMQELGNQIVNVVYESAEQTLRESQRNTLKARRSLIFKTKLDLSRIDDESAAAAARAGVSATFVSPVAKVKPTPTTDINAIKAYIEDKYIHKKWLRAWPHAEDDLSRELFEEIGRPSCSMQTCLQLVAHGADPNAHFTYGRTALHQAAILDSVIAIEFLLNHGARISERDQVGWSPVHYAAHLNHYLSLNLIIRRCDEEDVFAPTANSETPYDLAHATEATLAMNVLRNELAGVALLSVDDVISRNHVVVQLTARSEAMRGVSTRRAVLNRITSAADVASPTKALSRRKSKLRPHAPAPASPAPPAPPGESSPVRPRSGRRRRSKKSDGDHPTTANKAGGGGGNGGDDDDEDADAQPNADASTQTTTADPATTTSNESGANTERSEREADEAADVINGMKNEMLNEVDRVHVGVDLMRESLGKLTEASDVSLLLLRLSKLRPEHAAMAELAPSYNVPAAHDVEDAEDVVALKSAVECELTDAALLLSQLTRSLMVADIFGLLSLAKILRNLMTRFVEQ